MKLRGNNNIVRQSLAEGNAHADDYVDYLEQLLKDRKQLVVFPNVSSHVERILDEEIARVCASLFKVNDGEQEPAGAASRAYKDAY